MILATVYAHGITPYREAASEGRFAFPVLLKGGAGLSFYLAKALSFAASAFGDPFSTHMDRHVQATDPQPKNEKTDPFLAMQTDKEIFKKCRIWAVSPTVKEYNGITTSHLIHPDNWMPYTPSGLTRAEIAIWQYGVECHPIEDDMGKVTTFNLDLVRNEQVIVEKMF